MCVCEDRDHVIAIDVIPSKIRGKNVIVIACTATLCLLSLFSTILTLTHTFSSTNTTSSLSIIIMNTTTCRALSNCTCSHCLETLQPSAPVLATRSTCCHESYRSSLSTTMTTLFNSCSLTIAFPGASPSNTSTI